MRTTITLASERQDGNGEAHLKSGLVGPSQTIPVIDGELGLSARQNIFFCELDGPRAERRIAAQLRRPGPRGALGDSPNNRPRESAVAGTGPLPSARSMPLGCPAPD